MIQLTQIYKYVYIHIYTYIFTYIYTNSYVYVNKGPSEVLVIADDSADAATIAADMLAQVCMHAQ